MMWVLEYCVEQTRPELQITFCSGAGGLFMAAAGGVLLASVGNADGWLQRTTAEYVVTRCWSCAHQSKKLSHRA